jgi:hypothetical protein
MTMTPPTPSRRSARIALVSTVSLGLLAGPIAMATPAVADSKSADCTVKALKPKVHDKDKGGYKKGERKFVKVEFEFKIRCDKDAKVHFEQKMFQKDGKWKVDQIGKDHGNVWVHKHESVVNIVKVYDKDRHDKYEKVFHYVKIRVEKKDRYGKWAKWSDFDRSPVATIYVPIGRY